MNNITDVLLQISACLAFLLLSVIFLFYCERKLSAFIQDRFGPSHVGKSGILQPAADLIKLVQKETIIPQKALRFLFLFSPFLIFASVFSGFALVPVWPELQSGNSLPGGILLLLGIISIDAIAILMAGIASQSKFPLIGASRAVAQMISYEVPLGIALICFFWISNSAELAVIQQQQWDGTAFSNSGYLSWPWTLFTGTPEDLGGIFQWNIFRFPFLILLIPGFFLSVLAESNRAPFDIPEGESEIIGGFHTEYSGFLWAIFFLAEYAMMLILSLLMSYLFFGGNASPVPHFGFPTWISEPSFFWLIAKSWTLGIVMIWIRWSLPRLRVDQLMGLSWKVLTPVSLSVLLFSIIFK